MDFSSAVYSYQFSNLHTPTIPSGTDAVLMALFILLIGFAWFAGPYAYGYVAYMKKEREKREKKQKLLNFSIMKDLQTELEEEVKKSLTNANLS